MEKIVSIIIPSREYDSYVNKCISKIRALYKNIKIILILDEEPKDIKLEDNIEILKSQSTNMSEKRNQGVNYCNTKYIAFLDSDAYPKENWLETGINFLEAHQDYSAATGCWYLPKDGNTIETNVIRNTIFNSVFNFKEATKIIDYNAKEHDCNEFISANVIMRRQDYIDIGGMDKNRYIGEDIEFSQRLVQNNYKIRFIPELAVYHYERTLIPHLKKHYFYGYYYANNFIKRKKLEPIKRSFFRFLPLIMSFLYIILSIILLKTSFHIEIIFILPLLILLIFLEQAYLITKRINMGRKCYTFFLTLFTIISFCAVHVTSTLHGLLNLPKTNLKKGYYIKRNLS